MIQLMLLLVGMKAVQHHWRSLALIGAIWTGLGVVVLVDPLDGVQDITMHALCALLLIEGGIGLIAGLLARPMGWIWASRVGVRIIVGLLIMNTSWRNFVLISILFGIVLLVDGALRLMSILLVRFPGWRVAITASVLEIVLAVLAFTPWPVDYEDTVPFCVGVALTLSGWGILRSAVLLSRLPPDAPVTSLPIFEQQRGWYIPPDLPAPQPASAQGVVGPRMIVHVWTAVASAADPLRRPLLDRYVAAIDRQGTISTGHAALEMPPDLYISHYPATEEDRSELEFRAALDGSRRNNVPGRFLPGYVPEVADWVEATAHVEFTQFDPERLRLFWAHYRQDVTYNLTNRNCSVVVALALDAALEGILGHKTTWWTTPLLRLIVHPDLYIANLMRKRAGTMTWTPGLVLDYARALQRVVEPAALTWPDMVRQAAAAYRRIRRDHRLALAEGNTPPATPPVPMSGSAGG
jgi:uncharacterized membrane protein HdeD (DUF308 family)